MPAWYCLLRVTSSFIHYHSRLAVVLLGCAQAVWAQAGRAELFGTVRDPAGLAVAGATAELSEANTGLRLAALTGDRGEYHFAALLPGMYRVTVRKAGFRTLQRAGIELRVADRVAADLNLTLGDRNESVEVTASAPLLQTAGGALGFAVDGHTVGNAEFD